MKVTLLLGLICFCAATIHAQNDSYDLVTYTPPPGWEKAVRENSYTSYTITDPRTNSYCQIFIMLSTASKGSLKADFESEWQNLVVKQFKVSGPPQLTEPTTAAGWQAMGGTVPFVFNNGNSLAILTTMSGYGRVVSILVTTNSQDYLAAFEAFLASIELKQPETPALQPSGGNGGDTVIAGTWGKKAGVHQTYGDAVSYGSSGYTKDQYTFHPNGTYDFYSKTFRSAYNKIILVKETGNYRISGNQLTIQPQKSRIESWSKKDGTDQFGALVSTQDRALETVTYQFTRHYFSGLQEWNLVLQANSPTQRDGPFSGNTTFSNAWYYAPISSTNPVIALPGK